MRIVQVLISLFVFQSSAVVAFPSQAEYNFESQSFEHPVLIKDDVKCQIIDLHFQSEFVLFSEASEPENAHFKGCEDIAAKGGGRVFTQTAKEGDLLFYSTKIGDDVIEFGGNFSKSNGTLTIRNFDVDGALTNKLGIRGVKDIITDFGKQQGVNKIIIQGAKRTTGAKPGKIPSQLIFKIE